MLNLVCILLNFVCFFWLTMSTVGQLPLKQAVPFCDLLRLKKDAIEKSVFHFNLFFFIACYLFICWSSMFMFLLKNCLFTLFTNNTLVASRFSPLYLFASTKRPLYTNCWHLKVIYFIRRCSKSIYIQLLTIAAITIGQSLEKW